MPVWDEKEIRLAGELLECSVGSVGYLADKGNLLNLVASEAIAVNLALHRVFSFGYSSFTLASNDLGNASTVPISMYGLLLAYRRRQRCHLLVTI